MARHEHRFRLGRGVAVGVCTGLAAIFVVAPAAWAHVTAHPSSIPAGSSDVELVFRVPNERDNANTVTLQVFFPSNLPLLTVDVLPVPGWSETVHTVNLKAPVQTDDGPVSQVVSDVTWTATAGGIGPGQYEDFPVAAGAVPDHPGTLVFKALQTYSSGEIVRWIEVPAAGQPEPDFPAPEITLSAPAAGAASASGASAPAAGGSGIDGLGLAALVVAVLALAGAVFRVGRAPRGSNRS